MKLIVSELISKSGEKSSQTTITCSSDGVEQPNSFVARI